MNEPVQTVAQEKPVSFDERLENLREQLRNGSIEQSSENQAQQEESVAQLPDQSSEEKPLESATKIEEPAKEEPQKPSRVSELLLKFAKEEEVYRKNLESRDSKLKEIEGRLSQYEGYLQQYQTMFSQLQDNPIDFLERYQPGLLEKWNRHNLGMQDDPVKAVDQKYERMLKEETAKREQLMRQLEEERQKQQQRDIDNRAQLYRSEVTKESSRDDYRDVRSFLADLGETLEGQAHEWAVAQWQRGINISPQDAVKAVSGEVNRQIKIIEQRLQARNQLESKPVSPKAVEEEHRASEGAVPALTSKTAPADEQPIKETFESRLERLRELAKRGLL